MLMLLTQRPHLEKYSALGEEIEGRGKVLWEDGNIQSTSDLVSSSIAGKAGASSFVARRKKRKCEYELNEFVGRFAGN